MLPRYDIGITLHDLYDRVIQLEKIVSGQTSDELKTKNLFVVDSMKLGFVDVGEILTVDNNNYIISKKIDDYFYSIPHQTTIATDISGNVYIGTVQDIDITSNPTFNNETLTNNLEIGGSLKIAPSSYTVSTTHNLEILGQSLTDTIIKTRLAENSINGSGLLMQKSRGTLNFPSSVLKDDILGLLYFSGYDGNNWGTSGIITGIATENHSLYNHGTKLEFHTTKNGSQNAIPRMLIENDGKISILSTENTTNTTNGSLVVNGGIGIAKNIFVGGSSNIANDMNIGGSIHSDGHATFPTMEIYQTADATSLNSGVLQVDGGVSINKKLFVGTNQIVGQVTPLEMYIFNVTHSDNNSDMIRLQSGIYASYFSMVNNGTLRIGTSSNVNETIELNDTFFKINNTTQSTDINSGSAIVNGGIGIGKDVNIGGKLKINDTTQSTDINTGSIVVGGGVGINGNINMDGILKINDTTQSTDVNTGSVVIDGGLGIEKNIHLGGTLTIYDSTQSTDINTGSIIVDGGMGIEKNIHIGGSITIYDTTQTTDINTGSLILSGGLGIAKNTYIGSNLDVTGIETINDTTESTSTSTGSLIVSGGLGINKNTNIGGILNINDTTNSTDTLTGSLIVNGGASIAKNLYVGGEIKSETSGIIKMPHGFESLTDTVISYAHNAGVVTITISPISSSFNVWVQGNKYTFSTSQSVNIWVSQYMSYYCYFSNTGVFSYTTSISNINMYDCVRCVTLYFVYPLEYLITDDRHEGSLNGEIKEILYKNISTFYISGLQLSNYTLQPSTPVDTDNQYTCSTGVIGYENRKFAITDLPSDYFVLYPEGSYLTYGWTFSNPNVPYIYLLGSYIQYIFYLESQNQWTPVQISNNQYVNYYVLFIPVIDNAYPDNSHMYILPSTYVHNTLESAKGESIQDLILPPFPILYFLPLYKIIYYTNNSYSTTGKCRMEYIERLYGTKETLTENKTFFHNSLSGLQLAGSTITYGHINDQTQTIAGQKTLSNTEQSTSFDSGSFIISGGLGIAKNTYIGGELNILNTADSTSTDTGSLFVSGGLGIAKNTYIGGNLDVTGIENITNTTESTSTSTGSLIVFGGVGIAKNIYIGGNLNLTGIENITNTTQTTSTDTGSLILSGGLGIAKNTYIGGNLDLTGIENITDTTQTTSTDTGSLILSGGLGIAKNTYIGGNLDLTGIENLTNTTQSTSTDTGSLIVSGGSGIAKNLYVGGNETLSGILNIDSSIESTSITTGSLITTGGIGIEQSIHCGNNIHLDGGDSKRIYFNGGIIETYKNYNFGSYNADVINLYGTTSYPTSDKLELRLCDPTYTYSSNFKFDYVTGDLELDVNQTGSSKLYLNPSDKVEIPNTTDATSITTGVLNVGGGVGIAKNLYIGGNLDVTGIETINDTTESTSTSTGSLIISGGTSIVKNTYIGGNLDVIGIGTMNDTTESTSTNTGSLIVSGGASVVKNLFVGGNENLNGTLNINNTTESTSTSTGSLIVSGGLGIAKNTYIGGNLDLIGIENLTNTTESTSTSTGALILDGGLGIAKNINIGGTMYSRNNNISYSPHGFENSTDNYISYNNVTRILGINPVSTSFSIWIRGKHYQFSTNQYASAIPSTGGVNYYFYFTTSGLTYNTTFPDLTQSVLCATVYYMDSYYYILSDERHNCIMDINTLNIFREQIGTYYLSGLTLSGYTIQPISPIDGDNQFSCSSGVIGNEDLTLTIGPFSASSYANGYLSGTNGILSYGTYILVPFIAGTYIRYNQYSGGSWILTDLTNDKYVNYYILFVRSVNYQMITFPSQYYYSSLDAAIGESFHDLNVSTLTLQNYLPLYKITYYTNNTYTNVGKCRIETIERINGTSNTILNNITKNHEALSGLQLAGSTITYGHIDDQTQTIAGQKIFSNTTQSTSTNTGALIINGGMGISGNLNVGGSTTLNGDINMSLYDITANEGLFSGVTKITSATQSTSTSTGALLINGGVGIGEKLYINDHININNTDDSTSTSTGSLIVDGGVGIAKDVYIGGDIKLSGGVIGSTWNNITFNLIGPITSTTFNTYFKIVGELIFVRLVNLQVTGNSTSTTYQGYTATDLFKVIPTTYRPTADIMVTILLYTTNAEGGYIYINSTGEFGIGCNTSGIGSFSSFSSTKYLFSGDVHFSYAKTT